MKQSNVRFQYKGNRDYIHGTDMFNMFLSTFEGQKVGGIRFSVHGFVKQVNCDVYRSSIKSEIDAIQGLKARFQLRCDDEVQYMGLKESDTKILDSGRYPYDESSIIANSATSESEIWQTSRAGFSSLEEIVSLTKALHYKLFPSKKKWVFVQLELKKPLDELDGLYRVSLKQNLGGKYTRSIIEKDGEEVGWIGFSLV